MQNFYFKSLFFVSIVVLLGLPLNSLLDVATLTVALVLLISCQISEIKKKFILPFCILFLAFGLKHALPTIAIEEGHNIFLYDEEKQSVFKDQLPKEAFEIMKEDFQQSYPKEQSCSKGTCWRLMEPPQQLFAWAADGIWQKPKYSRVVSKINFEGITELRLGNANNSSFNFYDKDNDVKRGNLPYFVLYELPDNVLGGRISWRGKVIWYENGAYTLIENREESSKYITHPNTKIYGLGINPNQSLRIKFTPPIYLQVISILRTIITYGGVMLALWLFFPVVRWNDIKVATLSAVAGIATIALTKKSLILGLNPHGGGQDGLTHEGFARIISQQLVSGNYYEALRGVESVFYFMPGQRYLDVLQFFIFGDSHFAFVLWILFFSTIIYNLAKLFLPEKWAFYTFIAFAFLPIFERLGFALFIYVKEAYRGHPEPFGNGLFLLGLVLFFRAVMYDANKFRLLGFLGHLCFALSITLRPQLCIPIAVLMLFMFWKIAFKEKRFKDFVIVSIGIAPVFLLPYHNWYFGNAFVPLTSASFIPETLWTPPQIYLRGLWELVTGQFGGENIAKVSGHLLSWNKLRDSYRLIPFIVTVYAACNFRHDFWLRALATSGVSMHIVLLFYVPTGRYSYLAWMISFLVFIIILQKDIIPFLQRNRFYFARRTKMAVSKNDM